MIRPTSFSNLQIQIKDFIKRQLATPCGYKIIADSGNSLSIKGSVTEGVFTPVTKFQAIFEFKIEEDKVRMRVNGGSSPNWIFWILLIIGLFTGIVLLIAFVLYFTQRNKPKEIFDGILNSVDTEFSSI